LAEEKKLTFTPLPGVNLDRDVLDFDVVDYPCDLCINRFRCAEVPPEAEYFCDVLIKFEKLVDELNEKARRLLKSGGGKG